MIDHRSDRCARACKQSVAIIREPRSHTSRDAINDDTTGTCIERPNGQHILRTRAVRWRHNRDIADATKILQRTPCGGMGKQTRVGHRDQRCALSACRHIARAKICNDRTTRAFGDPCRVADLPLGLGRSFRVGGTLVAVFRSRTGPVFATQGLCPHKNGPLADGMLVGDQVVCPMHASRFDGLTGACDREDVCSIKAFPVREEKGMVVLEAGA